MIITGRGTRDHTIDGHRLHLPAQRLEHPLHVLAVPARLGKVAEHANLQLTRVKRPRLYTCVIKVAVDPPKQLLFKKIIAIHANRIADDLVRS